jgi:hypothetical protein
MSASATKVPFTQDDGLRIITGGPSARCNYYERS